MVNKIIRFLCFLGVGGMLALSSRVEAKTVFEDFLKDKGIEVSATGAVDFYSKYIWRGIRLDNDPVVQPSFTVSANGFALNVWGSYDVDNEDSLASNETDTTLSYTHTFEDLKIGKLAFAPVTVTGGNIYYDYSGTNTYTSEVYAGMTYGVFLSPTVTYYYDYIDESKGGGDGSYLMLSAAHSLVLNRIMACPLT